MCKSQSLNQTKCLINVFVFNVGRHRAAIHTLLLPHNTQEIYQEINKYKYTNTHDRFYILFIVNLFYYYYVFSLRLEQRVN